MELVEVVLYVGDMGRSVAFYRDVVGLELDHESPGWSTFRTGACTLALHAFDERVLGRGEPDPTFLAADAETEHRRLARAGVELSGLREPVSGVRVFDARDPDGNRFSVESRR